MNGIPSGPGAESFVDLIASSTASSVGGGMFPGGNFLLYNFIRAS